MRTGLALAAALVGAGLLVLAYAASQGQVSVLLVVVFPVLVSSGPWGFLGGLLLMAGILAGFLAFARESLARGPEVESTDHAGRGEVPTEPWRAPEPPAQRGASGGLILLGPIPIAFGTTKDLAVKMLLLGVAVLVLMLVLPVLLRGPA